MSRHKNKPVDMSKPPEERGKRRRNRRVATPPAQLAHATSPRARRQTRRGERWLTREENARFAEETPVSGRPILDIPGGAEALAVVYTAAEAAEQGENARFAEAGKALLLNAEGFAAHVRQRIAEDETEPHEGASELAG
jgi:hypothetical protein